MSELTRHESVNELLPWYVNGTLGDAEHALVEAHVHACLVCHLQLKKERQLQEFVQTAPTVDLSPEAGFDQLTQRLDDPALLSKHALAGFLARPWANWVSLGMTPRFALATLALAAIAALLWGVVPHPVPPHAADYFTLSRESGSANHLDVIFADHVTEPDMRTLLGEINGSIVAGPTQIGRYTVRLDDPSIDGEGLMELISAMSEDHRVRFAGPTLVPEPAE